LATERINASGGINGRPIELVIRDDKGTPEGARATDRELIKSGVVAIIGHVTSTQTKAALPVINATHTVLISPTAAASELSRQSHYFFRVISVLEKRASGFARSIYQRRSITRMAIVYDTDNAAYSLPYRDSFAAEHKSLGGKIVSTIAFSSRTKPDFNLMLLKLRKTRPDGILIIANSFDAALVAQRSRIIGWDVPLFCSGMAQMETVSRLGGKAIEGMEIEQYYNVNSRSPAFLTFKSDYQLRFGEAPTGISALAYETVEVLAAALNKTDGRREGLREALLETKDFKGLVDTFSFNKYGAAVRSSYVGIIRNGKTVTIAITKPPKPGGE
jgi:branched-chain amino acid transport system substrate-binding protein